MTNVMHVLDVMHSTNPCNHDFVFLSILMMFGGLSHCNSSASQLWILCKVLSFRWFIIIHNLVHVVDSLLVFFLLIRLYIYYYEVVCFFVYDVASFLFLLLLPPKCSLASMFDLMESNYHKIVSWIMKSMFWKNEFFKMMIMLIDCFDVGTIISLVSQYVIVATSQILHLDTFLWDVVFMYKLLWFQKGGSKVHHVPVVSSYGSSKANDFISSLKFIY